MNSTYLRISVVIPTPNSLALLLSFFTSSSSILKLTRTLGISSYLLIQMLLFFKYLRITSANFSGVK
ncbi:MAG: hypothetical protein QXL26_03540, partial [Zestosphaera sp.]